LSRILSLTPVDFYCGNILSNCNDLWYCCLPVSFRRKLREAFVALINPLRPSLCFINGASDELHITLQPASLFNKLWYLLFVFFFVLTLLNPLFKALCDISLTRCFFYVDELLASRPTKLEKHPLSAVHDSLFIIFAVTVHIWRPPPVEGKRPLGRRRRRWENNIGMNFKETVGGVDCMHVAQGRVQWRSFMNTVMNLRFPQKAGRFLLS
jgi:hypothetical protein